MNLSGEEAQTIKNLNNEPIVFQNYMKKTHNKIKILIKYIHGCSKTCKCTVAMATGTNTELVNI